jgi:prepilin-type N-terminal cleavage/methylation domain-containing protein
MLSLPPVSQSTLGRREACIPAERGFTLVELLVSTLIGALMLLAGTYMALSHVRTTGRQAVAHRQQTDFGRLSHLIETEVDEGSALAYGQLTAGCTNNGVASVFSITVPVLIAAETTAASAVRTIYYYHFDGNLRRCGPAINADGTLDTVATVDGIVITNALLTPRNPNPRQFEYSVVLTDPTSGAAFDSAVTPGWLFARAKSFQIN